MKIAALTDTTENGEFWPFHNLKLSQNETLVTNTQAMGRTQEGWNNWNVGTINGSMEWNDFSRCNRNEELEV